MRTNTKVKIENELMTEKMVNSFVTDIVYTCIEYFNISYDELARIFKKYGFFDKFNNTEVMVMGAHYGVNDIIKQLEDCLK